MANGKAYEILSFAIFDFPIPFFCMLRLIAGLLMLLEPLRFAAESLMVFGTLAYRGLPAAVELIAHAAVAALCAAAGLALWNGAPDSRRLGMLAVAVSVLRTAQSLYWSVLPANTRPGDEPLILGSTVLISLLAMLVIKTQGARAA
jgi:hypothetical protein